MHYGIVSNLETMSYYEMLVWFTEFMKNQMIPALNTNAEAVQELQTLYEELYLSIASSLNRPIFLNNSENNKLTF